MKFNCWPLHLNPRDVQRFSGPRRILYARPRWPQKGLFRILNFQNKLTPIKGNFEKKNQKGPEKRAVFCIVIKSLWNPVMILKY